MRCFVRTERSTKTRSRALCLRFCKERRGSDHLEDFERGECFFQAPNLSRSNLVILGEKGRTRAAKEEETRNHRRHRLKS